MPITYRRCRNPQKRSENLSGDELRVCCRADWFKCNHLVFWKHTSQLDRVSLKWVLLFLQETLKELDTLQLPMGAGHCPWGKYYILIEMYVIYMDTSDQWLYLFKTMKDRKTPKKYVWIVSNNSSVLCKTLLLLICTTQYQLRSSMGVSLLHTSPVTLIKFWI